MAPIFRERTPLDFPCLLAQSFLATVNRGEFIHLQNGHNLWEAGGNETENPRLTEGKFAQPLSIYKGPMGLQSVPSTMCRVNSYLTLSKLVLCPKLPL